MITEGVSLMADDGQLIEYATETGGGDMIIRYPDNEYQTLDEWFTLRQKRGVTVYRRVVTVIEGWAKVENINDIDANTA